MTKSHAFGARGVLTVLATYGVAVDAGAAEAGVDAGEEACAMSTQCAAPEPYCHPSRGVCVECLSNANCFSTTGVCDVADGRCVPCTSDTHCFTERPYCSPELEICVECISDANCEGLGLLCRGGRCGFCGDGYCAEREQYESSGTCAEDCLGNCPETDLGSGIGLALATGTTVGSESHGYAACGGTEGGEATFLWTAPASGTFTIRSGPETVLAVLYGRCSGPLAVCGSKVSAARLVLGEGQEIVLVVDTVSSSGARYSIDIEESVADAGSTTISPGECLARASDRGDRLCSESTRCACNRCPPSYDRCAATPGCLDIVACMETHRCVEDQCTASTRCGSLIERNGSVDGDAYAAAVTLAACERASLCELTCESDAGLPDGGNGAVDASLDAGGGAEDASVTHDGSATDASSFRSDGRVDAAAQREEDRDGDGGCGCGVPGKGARRADTAGIFAAFLGACVALARRRRRDDFPH